MSWTWYVAGAFVVFVVALVVMLTLSQKTSTSKEEKKKEKTSAQKTTKTLRGVFLGLFGAVVATGVGMYARSQTATRARRVRMLDQSAENVRYVRVLLPKGYPRNDPMLLAAGVYWNKFPRQFPRAVDVFDTKRYPSVAQLYDKFRQAYPSVETIPIDVGPLMKPWMTWRKSFFEWIPGAQGMELELYALKEEGDKEGDRLKLLTNPSPEDSSKPKLRMLWSNNQWALLIRSPSSQGYRIGDQEPVEGGGGGDGA